MIAPEDSVRSITYFGFRGRAEPIRLLFEDMGLPYSEDVVDFRAWRKRKPEMPFGRVPVYREGGLEVPESHAIMRHLARKHGLYGGDEIEATHCDVLADALRDALDAFVNLIWDKDFENKRAAFIKKRLMHSLGRLEQYLAGIDRATEYWVGSAISFVDYIGWVYLDVVRPLAPDALRALPHLAALYKAFGERPNIHAYLESERRYPTMTASMAYFGNTPETS